MKILTSIRIKPIAMSPTAFVICASISSIARMHSRICHCMRYTKAPTNGSRCGFISRSLTVVIMHTPSTKQINVPLFSNTRTTQVNIRRRWRLKTTS